MKSVSGKEFVKVLERHGWVLLRIKAAIIFLENKEAMFAFQLRFMEIK